MNNSRGAPVAGEGQMKSLFSNYYTAAVNTSILRYTSYRVSGKGAASPGIKDNTKSTTAPKHSERMTQLL